MVRFLKQIISGEEGQALPIVLALLVLGGLTIVPTLRHATTNLNSSRLIQQDLKAVYAADAGVEDALWSLENGIPPSSQLPGNINQMEVAMQSDNTGDYSLYLGELIEPGGHSDYIDVSGEMVWDEGAGAYKYTITVTWQAAPGTPPIKLKEIGARLPIGYSYQAGSAGGFPGNLSIDEPDEIIDGLGAYMLNWGFEPPRPEISDDITIRTQIFYSTGAGSLEGDYTWVLAAEGDIGAVGEIVGSFFEIEATATNPDTGETTAKIKVNVMIGETTYILSWQILN